MEPSIEWWTNLELDKMIYSGRFGKNKEEIYQYIRKQKLNSTWKHLGTDIFEENGIISFTETKENILMWSHYSKNHSGIVLEFDIKNSFFTEKFKDKNDKYLGIPQKVLYRKERVKELNYLYEPYFHKSLEWAYEQEYRMMLKLSKSDKIIIKESKCDNEFIANCIDPVCNGKLICSEQKSKEVEKSSLNTSLIKNENTMFMYKIPEESIKSIYLGFKISSEDKNKLLRLVKQDVLKHIKIYQAQIHDINYSLNFIEI
ncbi:DUF2971 domain-containing protein [Aliarcobacter cryaerophilus]